MLQDNVKLQIYCSIQRKKNNKNIQCDCWKNQLVNIYSKNTQKNHLKIRISVNGFFKRKDIYSTYS